MSFFFVVVVFGNSSSLFVIAVGCNFVALKMSH